jgi:outer membrane autotransporter protein
MLVRTQSGKLCVAVLRTGVFAGSVSVALGLLGSSAALAQNCSGAFQIGQANVLPAVSAAISGSSAVSAAVSAANTAFLTQSTAFVSAPANPKPESEGAGIWIRGVGGELTLNSNTQVNASSPLNPTPTSGACNTQFHQTFGGFQLGRDWAKLNVAGWNLTLGTTAGFLQTNGNIVGGNISGLGGDFNSTTQAPFVGMYGVATKGNFFIDGLVRADYFETNLNSPTANFFNQKTDAHGFTVAASAGYNWKVPNSNWFIEPSAGFVWSREKIDGLNVRSPIDVGSPFLFSGTVQVNDLESIIGRVGVRVGTTLETSNIVYSPFAAVSVWHDFAGDVQANWSTCPGCFLDTSIKASMTSNNIGTFGQYSVGVSGQLKNSGWLGFARVDYREGSEMHGLSGTGGLRYQFTPTEVAGVMPVKAKAPAPKDYPVNWTGWYVGAVGGATEFGRASMEFPGVSTADMRPSGWLGGGTLGYNFQAGRWVYGLEGDIAGTNTNGNAPCAPLTADPNIVNPVALFQTTCHDSLDWVATVTARLGYAWTPRSLVYVKAGGAFADEKASITCNFGSSGGVVQFPQSCVNAAVTNFITQEVSASTFRAGWTIGIGTEFALTDRWSIKGELDYLDFGTKSLTMSDGTVFNSTLHTAEGKIGLNYKFWP